MAPTSDPTQQPHAPTLHCSYNNDCGDHEVCEHGVCSPETKEDDGAEDSGVSRGTGGSSRGGGSGGGSSGRNSGGSSGRGGGSGGGGGGGRGGGEEEFAVLSDVPTTQGRYDVHANLWLTVAAIAVLGVLGCLMRHRCVSQKKTVSVDESYGAVSAYN